MYTHSSTAVPYGRGGAREPVLNLVPGHDGHGHIYGHGYGHFLWKLQKWSVVSGQYLGCTVNRSVVCGQYIPLWSGSVV